MTASTYWDLAEESQKVSKLAKLLMYKHEQDLFKEIYTIAAEMGLEQPVKTGESLRYQHWISLKGANVIETKQHFYAILFFIFGDYFKLEGGLYDPRRIPSRAMGTKGGTYQKERNWSEMEYKIFVSKYQGILVPHKIRLLKKLGVDEQELKVQKVREETRVQSRPTVDQLLESLEGDESTAQSAVTLMLTSFSMSLATPIARKLTVLLQTLLVEQRQEVLTALSAHLGNFDQAAGVRHQEVLASIQGLRNEMSRRTGGESLDAVSDEVLMQEMQRRVELRMVSDDDWSQFLLKHKEILQKITELVFSSDEDVRAVREQVNRSIKQPGK